MNDDWPKVRIVEIGRDFGDAPFGTMLKTKDYVDEGVPVIQGRNIRNNRFEWNQRLYVTEEKFHSLKRSHCREGDLVFPKVGTIGITAIMPRVEGRGTFLLSTNMMKMSVDPTRADLRFVYHYFTQESVRTAIRANAGGSSQPIFNFTTLKNFEISLPPLPVQRRIAGILSAYDDLIQNSQRRIRILEEMARALYREWFVEFRFPGHEKHARVASPLGDVPDGWDVKPLESLMADHIGGGWGKETADEDHAEPAWVIRGTDIPDARSTQVAGVPHRFHTVANLRTRRLQAGDILFEVSGGSKGQPVGRTLLVTPQLLSAFSDDAVICASFCKRIRPDVAGYGSELLYLSFLEGYESGEIEQFQVQSTGISNFKWMEYIAKTERVIPPEPLRVRFRERVTPLFSNIATLGLQIQNLRRTRDLLLPRLLSGQVELTAAAPRQS